MLILYAQNLKKGLILLFFLLPFSLFASQELIVHLNAQNGLAPLYIAPIQFEKSSFDSAYIASLEKVLRFDFENDGKTAPASASKSIPQLAIAVIEKKMEVRLTLPASGKVKLLQQISLTGNLSKDRGTIHQIHDALFEILFDEKGIAISKVLYTLKNRTHDDPKRWTSEVWQADYDGANAVELTHDHALCVTPVFIPAAEKEQRRHFLYVSYKTGQPKIFAAAIGESVAKRLTPLRGNQLMPAVATGCDQIAFISDITGNPDLFIQDFSLDSGPIGKPRQIFSAPNGTQGSPTFSPNGKQIAFVSNKDGTPRIYLLNTPPPGASIKEIKPLMISKKMKENTAPAWSPDGSKIAYSALTSGVRQIWIYDLHTQEEWPLTEGAGHKENPAWASNGLHLIYNSSSPVASDLFLINLNQKKPVKITQGAGEKRFPSWERQTTRSL